jgi:hypothetical protein
MSNSDTIFVAPTSRWTQWPGGSQTPCDCNAWTIRT